MSDGAVAPVGPCCDNSLIDYGAATDAWGGVKFEVGQFAEGFGDGAAFSSAMLGAGLHAVTQLGNGQLKGNFG